MPRKRKLPEGMVQRGRHYYADFYAGGQRVRKRLATDLDAAKSILVELRSRAEKADFGLLDNDYPLDRLRDQFLTYSRQAHKPGTVARYERSLKVSLPGVGVGRVSQLSVEAVLGFRRDRLAAGASPGTANYDVLVLGAMLSWGAKYRLIGSNPIAGIKPLPHDHPKEGRPLTPEEVGRLLDASSPHWRDVWYTLLVTGLRKEELASLTFDDIDWEGRELIVRGGVAKNHAERRVPIDEGLWEILKRQEAGRAARQPGRGQNPATTERVRALFTRDLVFVSTQNTPLGGGSRLYARFMYCCRRAGIQVRTLDAQGREIDHVDLHSLRRTFATDLIANGADPKSVQELLGHKTLAMTMKLYAKIHGHTKRQAVARLSYGRGVRQPEGVLALPAANPVQNGHQSVTAPKSAAGGTA
jgi:integrase